MSITKLDTSSCPKWDGQPPSYHSFSQKFEIYILQEARGWALEYLRVDAGIALPTRRDVNALGAQVYVQDNAKSSEGRLQVYACLYASVPTSVIEQIQHDADLPAEVPDPADPLANIANPAIIGRNPDRLWDAFRVHARGIVAEESGSTLSTSVNSYEWETNPEGKGTYQAQVLWNLKVLKDYRNQFVALGEAEWPFTESMLIAKFKKMMPARFHMDYALYTNITTIQALTVRVLSDSLRYDNESPGTVETTKMMLAIQQGATMNEMRTLFSTTTTPKTSDMGTASRLSRHEYRTRCLDKAAGPIKPNQVWCEVHGWCTHTPAQCKHGSSKSKFETNSKESPPQDRYVKNKDGTYSPIALAVPEYAKNPDGSFRALFSTRTLEVLINTGVVDEREASDFYVDSGAEHSMSKTLLGLINVKELNPLHAPHTVGIGGESTIATHSGTKIFQLDDGLSIPVNCFYPSAFNIVSTNDLAKEDVSTFIDASDAHNRMFLISPFLSDKISCKRHGNLFVMPTPPSTSIPSNLSDSVVAIATGTDDPPIDPPFRRVDYAEYRRGTGGLSHRATMSLAKEHNVKLIDNANKSQIFIDAQTRVANISSQPLVHVDVPESLNAKDEVRIVIDTIGNTFPMSRAGNKAAQTMMVLGSDSIHVCTSKDHTASTTWENFKDFSRAANLLTPVAGTINSNHTIITDNGSEFTGSQFQIPMKQAGIKHITSVPHKSPSGRNNTAELNNAIIQQGMRRNLIFAAPNFRLFGYDERRYWDYAMHFFARQRRYNQLTTQKKMTYVQYQRGIQASFGSMGVVAIKPAARKDHKQLANRGMRGILIGMKDHKMIMLLSNNKIMTTTDVVFDTHSTETAVHATESEPDRYSDFRTESLSQPNERHENGVSIDISSSPSSTTAHSTDDTDDFLDVPTFPDKNGTHVSVGDRVAVDWGDSDTYPGVVVNIDHVNGGFDVSYDDDDEQCHPIEDAQTSVLKIDDVQNPVLSAIKVLSSRVSTTPHVSVAQYVTETGDIQQAYLMGDKTLPPQGDLPILHRSLAPHEPGTVSEALASEHALFWLYAIIKEHVGHVKPTGRPATFVIDNSRTTPFKRKLFAKWVFVIKWDANGNVEKFKARLCLAGWGMERDRDYVESYTGTSTIGDLKDLEIAALHYNLSVFEVDLEQAYCHEAMPIPPDGDDVFMEPASGTRLYDTSGVPSPVRLQQAIYGHPASGFALARGIHDSFIQRNQPPDADICPVPLIQSVTQPVIFKADYPEGHEFHGETFWVWVYSDNIRTYTSNPRIQSIFMTWFSKRYKVTGGVVPLQQQSPQACLGMKVTYSDDAVSFSMPSFVEKVLANANMLGCNSAPTPMIQGFTLSKLDVPTSDDERADITAKVNKAFLQSFTDFKQVTNFYRSLVSSFSWIAKQLAPVLSLSVSILARVMHAPSWSAFTAVKRVCRFLSGDIDISWTMVRDREYDLTSGDVLEYVFSTDSSFCDDKHDLHSQGGYIGGPRGKAPSTHASKKTKRICASTKQAESAHAFYACKEIVYKHGLFTFLGIAQSFPYILYMDNQATVLDAGAPIRKFSQASKHFHIEEKYVVQCVEDGLIKVVHMPGSLTEGGDGFCVDALTKALGNHEFSAYYPQLQGPKQG